jgi:hypothetical protein
VHANFDLFKEFLGPQITAESLFQRVADTNESLDDILQKNTALEGILLGYGRHNALMFQRYHEITEALLKKKPPPWQPEPADQSTENILYFRMNATWQKPSEQRDILPQSGFASLEEEYQYFQRQFHKGAEVHSTSPLSCFDYPCFLTDGEDEETEAIVSGYVETRKKLAEIYFSGNFLEVSLKKMTGEI